MVSEKTQSRIFKLKFKSYILKFHFNLTLKFNRDLNGHDVAQAASARACRRRARPPALQRAACQ